MSQPTFYLPLNIQIAPYTARIMIKYKNMMLYMLVNNYQSLFVSLVLPNPNNVLYILFILCSA